MVDQMSAKAMSIRKLVRTVLTLALMVTVSVGAYWALDALRRNHAVETFEAALAAAQPGDVVDVREAFPLDWDRVVIVGPYEPGFSANEALGFDHYGKYDALVDGDSGQFIIFVNDRSVVADIRNWGPTWFAEDIRSFERDDAVFEREPTGWLTPLRPAT